MSTLTTNRTMKSFKIIACLILIAIAASGCQTIIKIPEYTSPEPVCDKENDQYFDFIETETCIRPVTYEQLYILDKYRFFSELAAETPDDLIKIRVGFKEPLDKETYENFIVEDENIIDIEGIYLFYPLLDNEGLGSHFVSTEQKPVERNNMLESAHNFDVEIFSDLYYDVETKTDPLYNREDMENYQIEITEVSMKASNVTTWWKNNKNQVRYIQALITDTDPIQTPYTSRSEIKPRDKDPVIDWENR